MTEEVSIDKSTLKLQRKERKQSKKHAKKLENQKAHEKKLLEIKLGPTDQKISIISRKQKHDHNNSNIPEGASNFNVSNDSFPSLEQTSHLKLKPKKSDNLKMDNQKSETKILTKPKSSTPITLNISSILSQPVTQKITPKNDTITTKYSGNTLDSSQPQRFRGKHRENPKRKVSKLKNQIIAECKNNTTTNKYDGTIHSSHFETYCTNIITNELNSTVSSFLLDIVRFQENLYKRDPIKGHSKRRYIVGMREVKKFLIVKRLKFVVIAPDISIYNPNGALPSVVNNLISAAEDNDISYIFALSKAKLGEITLKFRPISCVGVFDYSGAEEKYFEVLKFMEIARNEYQQLTTLSKEKSLQDDVTQELVNKFVNLCTS